MRPGRPVTGADAHRRFSEHQVGQHRTRDAARHLRGQVAGGVPPGKSAENGVDQRYHRVEVRTADRADHEDDGEQAGRGRRRVLQQLQPRVTRRQPLRRDPGTHDDGGEEGAADELRE
jgi:hypothetical protein